MNVGEQCDNADNAENAENTDTNSEECAEEHVGMFDSEETRQRFQNEHTDKRVEQVKYKRPKLGDAPTQTGHLGRKVCYDAEFAVVFKMSAYLDTTFIKDAPSGTSTVRCFNHAQ